MHVWRIKYFLLKLDPVLSKSTDHVCFVWHSVIKCTSGTGHRHFLALVLDWLHAHTVQKSAVLKCQMLPKPTAVKGLFLCWVINALQGNAMWNLSGTRGQNDRWSNVALALCTKDNNMGNFAMRPIHDDRVGFLCAKPSGSGGRGDWELLQLTPRDHFLGMLLTNGLGSPNTDCPVIITGYHKKNRSCWGEGQGLTVKWRTRTVDQDDTRSMLVPRLVTYYDCDPSAL